MVNSSRFWGKHALSIHLPTLTVEFDGLSQPQQELLLSEFAGFLGDSHVITSPGAVTRCNAYRLQSPISVPIQELTQNGVYTPLKTRQENEIQVTGDSFKARIATKPGSGDDELGVYHEQELAQPHVFENYLRILTARKTLELGGVMLHSAGLTFRDRTYIFAGRSGAGKTTLSRKGYESGAVVMSDDINLLLPSDNSFMAHPVPFSGEFRIPENNTHPKFSQPVACILLLSQRNSFSLSILRQSEAIAKLVIGCPYVNDDINSSDVLFNNLERLVNSVPVFKLELARQDRFETVITNIEKCLDEHR